MKRSTFIFLLLAWMGLMTVLMVLLQRVASNNYLFGG